MGGGTIRLPRYEHHNPGLSPRGRGNHQARRHHAPGNRSIPRVGGGTALTRARVRRRPGLSPRGRGKPSGLNARLSDDTVYPRVGGGTRVTRRFALVSAGLSPRGRGNHPGVHCSDPLHRSIPAWAGEPPSAHHVVSASRVYPRVGGGTHTRNTCPSSSYGLSPRGRGNHRVPVGDRIVVGSIPAWAGEPPRAGTKLTRYRVYPRVGGGTTIRARNPLCR